MDYYRTPFHFLPTLNSLPFGTNTDVYVISDSQYQEYKQAQTQQEIKVLETRAKSYEDSAESIRKTIEDLKKEANLLSTVTESK